MSNNYYQILGVNPSASHDEIRRAYRVLARRYHPDVNPGRQSEEKFKLISSAYQVLSDVEERRKHDAELERNTHSHASFGGGTQSKRRRDQERAKRRYQDAAKHSPRQEPPRERPAANTKKAAAPTPPEEEFARLTSQAIRKSWRGIRSLFDSFTSNSDDDAESESVRAVSLLEISVSFRDAVLGGKKTVEIPRVGKPRKISVTIPAGIRNGSVLRMRAAKFHSEELVFVVRVPPHPFLSIQAKGLVAELPITVAEAISGAHITVPTLEDPVLLKIPAGSQSGLELRLKERGIQHPDGTRGDLFFRVLIRVPTCVEAVGIQSQAQGLEQYYEKPVRNDYPKNLLEGL